jgi:hypothetical protein
MVEHAINVTVKDSDGDIVRDNTYWEDDIKRIGGVGAIVEAIEQICREGEEITISPMYYE